MKPPFKHVLLATEHTEFDAGAERMAFHIARQCGLALKGVLPAIINPEYEVVSPALAERKERELAEKLTALKADAARAGISLDLAVRRCEEGHSAIVQEAKDGEADLIILRRRGKQGFLSNLMIGEMVSKVAREAPCNLLYVPRHSQPWSQGVLVAVDESILAARIAGLGASIASAFRLPLILLCVMEEDSPAIRDRVKRHLEGLLSPEARHGLEVSHEARPGRAPEKILELSRAGRADLIVMGQHTGRKLFATAFGGTTRKVIGESECAVLVVKERSRN